MAAGPQVAPQGRFHIGHYIDACNEIIDNLQRKISRDEIAANRLKAAFQDIRDRFFANPNTFTFRKPIEVGLQGSHLYEDMTNLVAILQGTSEYMPLPAHKVDGEGRVYEDYSAGEKEAMRSEICAGVAIKINTVIGELNSRKRQHESEEDSEEDKEVEQIRAARKAAFDAAVASATRRRELRQTEAGCIELVRENGLELEHLDRVFRNNKNVVRAAVIQNGRALEFAHPRLQNDNDVVREALKHPDSDFILQHTGQAFRDNRAALLEAIRNNEMAIGYGNDELVEDLAFMLEAIDANPMVIQLFNEALRNDREIVVRALKVLIERREDPSILLRIVGQEIRPFVEAYIRISRNPLQLEHLDDVWKNDREIVLATVSESGNMLRYASEVLKNDREIVLAAVRQNSSALQYASEALRNDPEIRMAAGV